MHWMFLKVVADAGTHEEEEEKEEHEGADFLQDTLTFHSAPQLEPRWTRSGTTSSLIFR